MEGSGYRTDGVYGSPAPEAQGQAEAEELKPAAQHLLAEEVARFMFKNRFGRAGQTAYAWSCRVKTMTMSFVLILDRLTEHCRTT